MCRSSPSREETAGEEHSKEEAALEKTRPWGLLMKNLGHPLVP